MEWQLLMQFNINLIPLLMDSYISHSAVLLPWQTQVDLGIIISVHIRLRSALSLP